MQRDRAARSAGWTLIETMIVVAVIGILAAIALPSIQDKIVRDQIVEAVKIADIAKAPIAAEWAAKKTMPADNAAAGLPEPQKIVGNFVASLTVEGGAIQLRFGNRANAAISGKTLSLRPGVVEDAAVVPIAWVCGNATAPPPMAVKGPNRTDVPSRYLPANCKG